MLAETELLLVVVGFMIAFALAFSLGANDVANSFGTSVGSKVLTLRAACILATIAEISGSVLLGGEVSETIRTGIIKMGLFNGTSNPDLVLMYGQVASLASACIWMLLATFFKMPISGSHSIVGATAGFGLVLFGSNGIEWWTIGKIAISWVVSPLLSGIISSLIFFFLKLTVLKREHPLEPALYVLPFFYCFIVIINVASVLKGGLGIFGVREIPGWIVAVSSLGVGLLIGLIVFFFVRPYLRRKILRRLSEEERSKEEGYEGPKETGMERLRRQMLETVWKIRHPRRSRKELSSSDAFDQVSVGAPTTQPESIVLQQDVKEVASSEILITDNRGTQRGQSHGDDKSTNADTPGNCDDDGDADDASSMIEIQPAAIIQDRPEEAQVFTFAQILSAVFGSFVHGANDVSNAIGPVVGLWLVAISGDPLNNSPAPIWILLYGGFGISVGLWIWGRKVMETIGTDLTTITPSSGVCIELGSAATVLLATNLRIPVSTTHCKVGSVVCVGYLRSKSNVNWKLFLNIVITWIITLPISGGLSALIMYAFIQTQNLQLTP